MNVGPYRLLAQRGVGRDGVSYRAQVPSTGKLVEVRVLSGAKSDRERWQLLSKRLPVAKLLEHPAALRVCELDLGGEPPYVALEWQEGESLAAALQPRVPLPAAEIVALALELAGALAAAHRLGIAHGRICPGTLLLTAAGNPKIDFTGCDAGVSLDEAPCAELDASCRAPEVSSDAMPIPPADVFGLGALLHWGLTGQPAGKPSGGPRQDPTQQAGPLALAPPETAVLELLVQEMLDADPAKRPWAKEVVDRLAAFQDSSQLRQGTGLAATSMFLESAAAPPAPAEESLRAQLGRERLLARLGQGASLPADIDTGARIGRYRLLDKLGQGGMGAVYKAEDVADGTIVAVKVIRADIAGESDALRRFHKEARLLAEINNPYVTSLLDVNEDQGVHYLVLEFVAGQNLGQLLAERRRLDERTALSIMADVARALIAAHERGIVHRDIKPENILLVSGGVVSGGVVSGESSGVKSLVSRDAESSERSALGSIVHHSPLTTHHSTTHHSPLTSDHSPLTTPPLTRVKLADFGLARYICQTESLKLTQKGDVVGTPWYMAPEQCRDSSAVDTRADIYAIGATLFHVLAGRPPFEADTPFNLIAMHCNDPAPPLKQFNDQVSEGTCLLVDKCLAKFPEARYDNAGDLLRDLERLLRGEPTGITVHPRIPECDPRQLLKYDWSWELESSPQQLWPYISNTERLNRAIGLPAVQFTTAVGAEGSVRRRGQMRRLGMTASWQEHPFEWIEARRMGVLREYDQGPFQWLVSSVEMVPRPAGGTTLTHQVRIAPRGLLGRTAAAVEVNIKGRRALDQVYRRIDAALTGKLGHGAKLDVYEEPVSFPSGRRRRLEVLLDRLSKRQVDPAVLEQLGDFLARAPAQEVARIRPLAWAQRFGLDPMKAVTACLHGAREGLLLLLWDILCPICRIPSEVKDTLRGLREHAHCEACNLSFETDFANSVEMIFRAHPEIRASELGTYCIGGPAHSPHVVAQVRVGPSERIELDLSLTEGTYQLRGPQLPYAMTFRVQPSAQAARWDFVLARGLDPEVPRSLKTGRQLLVMTNDHAREVVLRVERAAPREDALTAARASSLALFRELFPGEILSPGHLVSVATVTLLVTGLDRAMNLYEELGDPLACALMHEYFRVLEERIRGEGGALVKSVGEGLLAVFNEPVAAVRVGLELPALLARNEATESLQVRVAVHRGSAMVATVNDRLDYLGASVHQALELLLRARGGELVLSQSVATDPQVVSLLKKRALEGEILEENLAGPASGPIQRIPIPGAGR